MSFVTRYLDPELVERLNHLQLSARSVVEGPTAGQHKSPVKGASVEFRQHRFYVPGDEPRRLDWRVLGRTDRPYIKEYDEETNLRAALLLDTSGSMAYGGRGAPTKFDYAARVAASLAYLMLGQTESVGLALVGKKLQGWIPPRAGSAQLARLVDVLERAVPRGETDLSAATHELAERLGRRALVVIISDFFAPVPAIRGGLAHLRHDKHEMICLRILDNDELTFPFRTWSRFRGLEGERPHLCEPALARKSYLDRFNQHRQDLQAACHVLGAELHTFVTQDNLIDTVTRFLRRRVGM